MKVTSLRSVEIGACNLNAVVDFYGGIFGLRNVALENGVAFLRGTGPAHHSLAIHHTQVPCIIRVVLEADDKGTVDALHASIKAWSDLEVEEPSPIQRADGGYGFGFKDAEGRNFAIVCDANTHRPDPEDPYRPTKLSHVNLNSDDWPGSTKLLTDVLGFELRDETKIMCFLGCNPDHHSVVIAKSGGPTLNHISFEMPDLEAVMLGTGRLSDAGYPIEWGVGRHGPGNNMFAYFAGPEEFPIEYCSEMFQVDGTYKFRGPDEWVWPPGRVDQWGVGTNPTKRLKRIQSMVRFTGDGHLLHQE